MEKIDLDLDDENEMTFNVQIEGTRPGEPLCRLMIEGRGISHVVIGDFLENNEVSIVVPPMKGILKEGTYDSYLEVLIDDRVFVPLELNINFEKSVKVVAESVSRKRKPKIKASASLKSTNKKPTKIIKEEQKTQTHPAKRRYNERKEVQTVSDADINSLVKKLQSQIKK